MTLMDEAYEIGKLARAAQRMRVSPFYNERCIIAGKRVDVTPMLDAFFLAGYDGQVIPEGTNNG
jgi:hypothetical protein